MRKIFTYLVLMTFLAGFVCEAKAEKPDFSGFSQFLFKYGKQKTFSVPLVVVALKGNLSDKIAYKMEADVANQNLREAWISYKVAPWLKVKAGQQFMFYTVAMPPNLLETVEYPKATCLATIYDIGLMAEGSLGMGFYYRAGIVNGTVAGNTDNNGAKDIYSNLSWKPKENLSIGAVYQAGNQPDGKRTRYGTHVKWQINSDIYVLSEYFHEKYISGDKNGCYCLMVINWKPKLQFVQQLAVFSDNNTDENDWDEVTWTFGFNYFPVDGLKLQANYSLCCSPEKETCGQLLIRAQISF